MARDQRARADLHQQQRSIQPDRPVADLAVIADRNRTSCLDRGTGGTSQERSRPDARSGHFGIHARRGYEAGPGDGAAY